jgi:hypothetical protein
MFVQAQELVTVGGSGTIGYADGAGPDASFHGVKSVSWSPKLKKLFASDFFNHRIRTLTPPNTLPPASVSKAHIPTNSLSGVQATSTTVVPAAGDDESNDIRVMVWTGHCKPVTFSEPVWSSVPVSIC